MLTAQEMIAAIRQTQEALRKSDKVLEKVLELGVMSSLALRMTVELPLHDHVRDDLNALEDALEKYQRQSSAEEAVA